TAPRRVSSGKIPAPPPQRKTSTGHIPIVPAPRRPAAPKPANPLMIWAGVGGVVFVLLIFAVTQSGPKRLPAPVPPPPPSDPPPRDPPPRDPSPPTPPPPRRDPPVNPSKNTDPLVAPSASE